MIDRGFDAVITRDQRPDGITRSVVLSFGLRSGPVQVDRRRGPLHSFTGFFPESTIAIMSAMPSTTATTRR